ncbi:MAG TPA: hypothetical protein VGC84_04930 [Ilumatobacteraceae bacterium]|jgi:hypothetical protein
MTRATWLVSVSARGQQDAHGIDADVALHRTNLGGVIRSHGFGPGSVDLELKVSAATAAEACAFVRQRVTDVLGPEWMVVDVLAGAQLTDVAS